MKKNYKNRNIRCEDIEELLIKQNIEILSEEEDSLVQKHLKACINCQSYQKQFATIQNSMKIDQKSSLQPDPAIRENLINQIAEAKSNKYLFFELFWQGLLSMLKYRIPVYQLLIGTACCLLIFIVMNSPSLSFRPQTEDLKYTQTIADTTFSQINVVKNLQIIEQQKIGRNVSQDSLLTRFIVSSM